MGLDMALEKINYRIQFLTDWHAGSGLSAGAEADAVVIKDPDGFPYIPGKTLKGLFRDAFQDLMEVKNQDFTENRFKRFFGFFDGAGVTTAGKLFYSSACLSEDEKSAIDPSLNPYLYRTISATAISEKTGVAKNSSLRVSEVCIPLELEGFVEGIEIDDVPIFEQLLKYIRTIGANRNRGLGRCIITIKK